MPSRVPEDTTGRDHFGPSCSVCCVAGTMQGCWWLKDVRSEAGHALPMQWLCQEDEGRGEGDDEPLARYVCAFVVYCVLLLLHVCCLAGCVIESGGTGVERADVSAEAEAGEVRVEVTGGIDMDPVKLCCLLQEATKKKRVRIAEEASVPSSGQGQVRLQAAAIHFVL